MSWHGVPVAYTDRANWLELRRAGIGASDVASILELSPYGSPFSVWADKVKGAEKDQTEAMRFGKKLEVIIEDEFQEQTGLYIGARELLIHHPIHTWAMATIDGLAFESVYDYWDGQPINPDDVLANVEFKTDGGFGRWELVPDHYQIQVQWQMFVEGLDQTMIATLHGGRRFELYEIEADPIVQQKMLDMVAAFREKHLLDPEAPPPDVDAHPATSRALADVFGETTEDEIELSHGMYADLKLYAATKSQIKGLEAEAERLKNRLAVSMQAATVGTWGGREVLTYRERVVKEHVRKESRFRVLNIKLEEEK